MLKSVGARLKVLVAALACFGASACAGGEPPVSASAPPALLELLEYAREDPVASDQQIAVLELAAREGRDVTEAEYREAFALAVDCTRDAGVNVVEVDEVYGNGSLELYMSVNGQPEDEEFMFTTLGHCQQVNVDYIASSLQRSAASRNYVQEVERRYRPLVIACLQAKGVTIADNASMADAAEADVAWRDEQEVTDGCIQETGMNAELSSG